MKFRNDLAQVRVYLRSDDTLHFIDSEIGELDDMHERAAERKANNKDYCIAIINYTPIGTITL